MTDKKQTALKQAQRAIANTARGRRVQAQKTKQDQQQKQAKKK